MKITFKELKTNFGLFIFGVGSWLVALELREWIKTTVPFPGWMSGVLVVLIALYLFDINSGK